MIRIAKYIQQFSKNINLIYLLKSINFILVYTHFKLFSYWFWNFSYTAVLWNKGGIMLQKHIHVDAIRKQAKSYYSYNLSQIEKLT